MKKIAILIEHPDRELVIAESISKAIEEADNFVSVDIMSILFNVERAIFSNHYDLIIFPSSWPIINSIGLIKYRISFVSFNFEQMLSSFNEEAKRPKKGFITSGLHHFSWSNEYTDYLTGNSIQAEKIHQIQKPIYQALERMPDTHSLSIDNKLMSEIAQYDKIIFIPLTCLQGFKTDERLAKEFGAGILYERAVIRRDFVKRSIHKIFHWIAESALSEARMVFVLRPHPSVPTSTYYDLFQQLEISLPPNVLISDKGTAIEWVTKSDFILSNYSSLLLDGMEYNTPSFILQPYTFPEDISYDWFSNFKKIECYESLRDVLQFSDSGLSRRPATHGVDGSATAILSILRSDTVNDKRLEAPKLKDYRNTCVFALKSLVRRFLFHWAPFLLRGGLKRDYFLSKII
ncbi:hypothetical protein N9J94_05955 [Planktomarina sp.]|nr:hypothetical protein [Planktomarina sp.]MDA9100787.1 hypothetical protein [Planktomarina sp.]